MIIICEPICKGLTHVPINCAFLEMIYYAYPSRTIVFWGEQFHLQEIQNQISNQIKTSILWEEIPDYHLPLPEMKSYLYNAKLLHSIINKYSNQIDYMLFTSADSVILLYLKIYNLFFSKIHVQIVFHSNLNQIIGWRSMNPFVRMLDLKSALLFNAGNRLIQYVVLEKASRDFMLTVLPSLKGNVEVVEHPIPPNEFTSNAIKFGPPYKIGFLGITSETKGFSLFLKLAEEINRLFGGNVEFLAIGSTSRDTIDYDLKCLHKKPSGNKLSRTDYVENINQVHYICLPYSLDSYKLNASGALLDAIAYEKPIVSFRLSIIENLFNKYGSLGYLCDSYEDMIQSVKDIINKHDDKKYHMQKNILRKIAKERSPSQIAKNYRQITDKLLFT
jgi:hypothetical protein